MKFSVIAGLTRNPCRTGYTSRVGQTAWMPGQARHDKTWAMWPLSVIADLIRNPCRASQKGCTGQTAWMPGQVRHDKL